MPSEEQGAQADDVDIARPPRSAAASAEVVLSGQVALDLLDQVTAVHFLFLLSERIAYSYRTVGK